MSEGPNQPGASGIAQIVVSRSAESPPVCDDVETVERQASSGDREMLTARGRFDLPLRSCAKRSCDDLE